MLNQPCIPGIRIDMFLNSLVNVESCSTNLIMEAIELNLREHILWVNALFLSAKV